MKAQKFIQFTETFIVFCQSGIEHLIPPAELDAGDGFNAIIPGGLHKIHDTRGVVDIGQRQGINMIPDRLFNKIFHGDGAVAQRVV
jgi:hypothetical protein